MSGFTDKDRKMLTEVNVDMKHVKASVKDHEKRLRVNEKKIISIFAVVGAIPVIAGLALGIKKIFMT